MRSDSLSPLRLIQDLFETTAKTRTGPTGEPVLSPVPLHSGPVAGIASTEGESTMVHQQVSSMVALDRLGPEVFPDPGDDAFDLG